jgi:RHS repeat-associated protein
MQYLYDADGNRIAKGTVNSLSCDRNSNGFRLTTQYIVGASGEQVSELDGTGKWLHSNVYGGGQLLGTYDSSGLHYNLTDALGTKRKQVLADLSADETCSSLPFGNMLDCSGTDDEATEHHFTGKERDTESGNDYFEARYYSSTMGRFLSPDWSAKEEPVPYADLSDPQSLNLYGYVRNNPLSKTDPDGHWPDWGDVGNFIAGVTNAWASDNLAGAGRVDQSTEAGKLGAAVGDFGAAVQGGLEVLGGGGGEIGGAALDVTGAGAVVGVPLNVASTTAIAHGGATVGTAAVNLFKAGGNFSSKTKQEVREAAGGKCEKCSSETVPAQKSQKGVKPPGNEGQTDHKIPKSKGGTNDPSNAAHLCRDCNRQKSDKMPNQQ